MKITRSLHDIEKHRIIREQANVGCNICPCCGESRKEFADTKDQNIPIMRGIKHWFENREIGFFIVKHMIVDKYRCHTCGAEWESEEYEAFR